MVSAMSSKLEFNKNAIITLLILFIVGVVLYVLAPLSSAFALWSVIILLFDVILFFMFGMLYASARSAKAYLDTMTKEKDKIWEEESEE